MISLLAHGLCSPLGPADIAAAALAAGLARPAPIAHAPVLGVGDDAGPAIGHAVLDGEDDHRLARLLALAWAELGPVSDVGRVLLCEALPDPLRLGPEPGPDAAEAVAAVCGRPPDERFALGHAAPAAALVRADELLAARACRRVLVVAVDSLLTARSLAWLAADDRLRGPETPDGLAPGEAAVWCLVAAPTPTALAHFEARYRPCDGARAPYDDADRLLATAAGLDADEDWTDQTGEPWRDRAWGAVAHRLPRDRSIVPAEGWGDLGAATALASAATLIAGGRRPAVVWSLAEDGGTGVIGVR